MCGISGIVDFNGHSEITHDRLRAMADTMTHRGPDDAGTYVSPDGRGGLGFRRLSIVDLAGGHQPMGNDGCPRSEATGEIRVVFNGEIYNHRDIRRELEARGHVYRTQCDTEAIVHGYEEWGDGVVERLRGMFAFAVLGGEPGLFLARDRLGIKPLYYTHQGGRLIFASEIKAILEWPGVGREVCGEALYHYLTLSVAPAPLTMFRDIRKLPPGTTLSVGRDGSTATRRYWEPMPNDGESDSRAVADLVDELRERLRESIRLRMMSDVPFGVFLSGGVDSSLNVALMSELMDRPVDTFSIAIEDDPASDELSQARRVARHYGTNHHEVVVSERQFIETLPEMVHHQDEPLADPVCVPLYHVSKLARENGTIVVQVGEGADELFAGYVGYSVMADLHRRLYAPFAAMPSWIKRPVAALAPHLLPAHRAEYVRRAASGEELFWGGATVFTEPAKRRLLRNGFSESSYDSHADVVGPIYSRLDGRRPGSPFLDRMIYLELEHRLPELLLMRVDKMSMAASVEARVPFLDHELVEFALSIPPALKYRGGRTKYILKEAARGILPDDVIDRPKVGFCGGAGNMVSGAVVDYAEQVMSESEGVRAVLNPNVVNRIVAEHRAGRADNSAAIWSLLNLALWHRQWIEGRVVAS